MQSAPMDPWIRPGCECLRVDCGSGQKAQRQEKGQTIQVLTSAYGAHSTQWSPKMGGSLLIAL